MKYPCDRCGGNTHEDDGEDWLDMAGNCERCGDDLCPTCASEWPGGGPYCEKCYIEYLLETYQELGNTDEHHFLGKEVMRLKKLLEDNKISY
jgi:hypothetical protein